MKKLSTDIRSQQMRLLKHLTKKPATTIELRKMLDIMMPGARVYELRHHHGHNIKLHWVNEVSDAGVSHRIRQYILFPGKWGAE